jgi:hypothetical protein
MTVKVGRRLTLRLRYVFQKFFDGESDVAGDFSEEDWRDVGVGVKWDVGAGSFGLLPLSGAYWIIAFWVCGRAIVGGWVVLDGFRKKGQSANARGSLGRCRFAWVVLLGTRNQGTDTSSLGTRFACVSPQISLGPTGGASSSSLGQSRFAWVGAMFMGVVSPACIMTLLGPFW